MSSVRAVDKKKGQGRPKSEASRLHISQPFNFKHDFHVPLDDVDARSVDGSRSLSPPPPCPGSKDGSSEFSIPEETQYETLLRLLKEEIIPTLHIEIGDIIEKKLQKVLDQLLPAIKEGNRHCPKCRCPQSDQIRYSPLETPSVEAYVNIPTEHRAVDNTYVTDPNIHSKATQRQDSSSDNDSENDQLPSGKPVSNPIYPISGGDTLYLPVHTMPGTLVKYGSEIHLVPTQTATQSQIHTLQRSNTMPIRQGLYHSPATGCQKMRDPRGVRHEKADERECLANALQMNVIELVNDVIFKDSELPDSLLADGCLTENESTRCRKYPDPRDQVRLLLSIIKGRDLDVLKRFLKNIKLHNESVAQNIVEQFERNKKQGMRSKACALCKLTGRVDLKYIADSMYKHFLVDDGLYNIIFQTERPPGAQDEIWHKVIGCLNAACVENAALVKKILTEALDHKNHYNQLAKEVQWMISNQNEISCRCEVKFILPSGDSILSIVSSKSPHTSISDVREEVDNNNVPDMDETDEEATTPVQKDLEQTLADKVRPTSSSDVPLHINCDETFSPENSKKTHHEVDGSVPKPHKEQVVQPTRMQNKIRARNNATSSMTSPNEMADNLVNNDTREPLKNIEHTPRYKPDIERKKKILLHSDLVSSNV